MKFNFTVVERLFLVITLENFHNNDSDNLTYNITVSRKSQGNLT